jgi:Protein of unknown function (DUF3160).
MIWGELSRAMQHKADQQYNTLKGTEWEEAAKINLAYFTVGSLLMNPNETIHPEVNDVVGAELTLINAAGGVSDSPLFTGTMEDYSQYKTAWLLRG